MNKKPTTPKTKAPKSSKKELSFEDSLRELQKIVQQLEQGDLGLSESLDSYESGVQDLKQCYRQLAKAEQKVELLREVAEDGSSVTEPFEEDSMSLEEKAAARGARRTRKPRSTNAKPRSAKAQKSDEEAGDHVDDSPGLF